jgi:hypothetical protein
LIAIGFATAAVSIDRQQAEKLCLTLSGAMLMMSVLLLAGLFGGFAWLGEPDAGGLRAAAEAGSAYGVVLFAAIIIMIMERYLTRSDFRSQLLNPLAGAVSGLVICGAATVIAAPQHTVFAAACGLVTVALVYIVRRIGLGWRAAVTVAGVGIIAAALVVSASGTLTPADISVRYAAHASGDRIAVTTRIVGEVGIGGSGAGTFAAIHPLYATQDTSTGNPRPLTFASQIAVELGRPALWIIALSAVTLIVLCARGGFNRGRDFVYSIAGAGVGVATMILAFCDSGLTNPAVSILFVSTLGLALVQSVSRTI